MIRSIHPAWALHMQPSQINRLALCLVWILPALCWAQESEEGSPNFDAKEAKATRLEYVMGHAKALTGTLDDDKTKIIPIETALLRWTNPYSNVKDGFLVGWTDEKGLPVAIGQIYLLLSREDAWGIELQSLSQEAFTLASKTNGPWRPRKPGMEWKPVPNSAPEAAKSKPLRLSQMRAIARRFRASDDFADEESELRLLTNPLLRYNDDDAIVDGAVFAMVHGTDPEMIISIELRNDKTGKQLYHYALAPMTGYELRCRLDNNEVWKKPRISSNRATDVFWQSNVSDVPRGNLFRQLLGF